MAYEEFTGELDQPAKTAFVPFTGELDAPVKARRQEIPASNPMSSGFDEIMAEAGPAKSGSVLDGLPAQTEFNPAASNFLSNRKNVDRLESLPRAGTAVAAPISGKTIPINQRGTLGRAADLVGSQVDSYSAGLGYKLGDAASAVGAKALGGDLKARASALQDRADTTSQSVSLSADGAFEKYAPQILAVFPTLAVAGMTGAALPAMFGIAEMQSYSEGRKAGLTPGEALARSIPMASAEIIGEKLGGTGALINALEKAAVKGGSIASLKELSGRLVASGMREVPSEEATYAMQFGIDKAPGIGLKPNAGFDEFIEGAKDTAIVSVGAGGLMAGGGMAISRLAGREKQLPETYTPPDQPQPVAAPTVEAQPTTPVAPVATQSESAVSKLEALLQAGRARQSAVTVPSVPATVPPQTTPESTATNEQNAASYTPFTADDSALDPVPKAVAAADANLPGGTGELLATGATQPDPVALNGAPDDANTPPRTPAEAQAETSQAPEAGAIDAPGITTAGIQARASDVQADGLKSEPNQTLGQSIRAQAAIQNVAPDFTKDLADARTGLADLQVQRKAARGTKRADLDAQIGRVEDTITELEAETDPTPTAAIRLGRDNQALSRGGKPFVTNKAAKEAKALQPMMRVVRVEGGFALAEKTERQLAAEQAASRRLRNPQTSPRGEAIPAHAFIAAEGGLRADTRPDMNVGINPRIGNRNLFAGQGKGLGMEEATERLIERGYLPDGSSHDDARNIIKRSMSNPQYTPEGVEMMAEKQAEAQFQDYLAAQQEAPQEDDADPFGPFTELGYLPEDIEDSGYVQADKALKLEVQALTQQADALGIDTETIREKAFDQTRTGTDQDYNEAARELLQAAVQGSPTDRSEDSGEQGAARSQEVSPAPEGLTAPTQQDVLDQQDRAAAGDKANTSQRKAEQERLRLADERKDIAKASEAAADTFELGGNAEQNLSRQGGIFSIADQQATAYTPPDGLQPATARQQALADQLAARINAGRPAADTVLHAVVARAGSDTRTSRSLAAVALAAKRLFGHEVVFVDFGGAPLFNGAVSRVMPDVIFIRVDSDKPLMAVLGHELLHKMRSTNPGLYLELDEALTSLLSEQGASAFLDKLSASYEKQGMQTPVNWDEELWADVAGDNFMDPEFLKALGTEQPDLFKRIVTALTKFLNEIIERAGGSKGAFGTDAYLTDVKAARDAMAKAFREFSGTQVGAMTDQRDTVALSIADKPKTLDADIRLQIPLDGGGSATLTINAKNYLAQLDARQEALQMVKECMG